MSRHPSLLNHETSLLLVVDVQQKLVPLIFDHDRVVDHCRWLIEVAQAVSVPVVFSEQYPRGLGPTVPELRGVAPEAPLVDKVHFSCVAAKCLPEAEMAGRNQVVLCGIEAHVCVQQTALDLLESGRQVYVVADAVGSRHEMDRDLGIQRMRDLGVQIITREMALFEWAHQAGTPLFKQLSQQFLR